MGWEGLMRRCVIKKEGRDLPAHEILEVFALFFCDHFAPTNERHESRDTIC